MTKNIFKLKNFYNIAGILLPAMFFLFDRIFKKIAINSENSFSLIKDLLIFNFTKNYYISFSLPIKGQILNYSIFAILLLLIIYIVYLIININKDKYNKLYIFLFFALLLGALSNYIDRISLGFVVDYLQLKYFTVFNMADVLISTSSILIIILNFKSSIKTKIQ